MKINLLEVYEKYGLITLDNINQEVLLLSAENNLLNDLTNYIFDQLTNNKILQYNINYSKTIITDFFNVPISKYFNFNIPYYTYYAININYLIKNFDNDNLFSISEFNSTYENKYKDYIINLDLFNVSKINKYTYTHWLSQILLCYLLIILNYIIFLI